MTETLVNANAQGTFNDPLIVQAVTGSIASPVIVAQSATITIDRYAMKQTIFVASSTGAYSLTSNPQISPGLYVGQTVTIIGTDDTDAFTFVDGAGLELNGPALIKNESQLELIWDGSVWSEISRTDVGVQVVDSDITLSNRTIHLVSTAAARLLTLPPPSTSLFITLKDMTGTASSNTVTLVRPGSEEIETVAADFVLNTDLFSVTVVSDGTDYFLI